MKKMFEYIKLKNFKSLGEIMFDMRDRNNNPKKLVIIYGPNGVGKSNLISSFYFLLETLRTMEIREFLQNYLENNPDKLDEKEFRRVIESNFLDLDKLVKKYKMIGSEEYLCIEYGFNLDGKSGSYTMHFNDEKIIYEKLEYTIVKNRGTIFEIDDNDKLSFSEKVFMSKDLTDHFNKLINKYWGKHSFLAILKNDIHDKNKEYFEGMLQRIEEILDFFDSISSHIKHGTRRAEGSFDREDYLIDYSVGTIEKENEEKLNKAEVMISRFLNEIYPEIKRAYYNKTYINDKIKYELILQKEIYGKDRDIKFSEESTGIQSIVDMLPFVFSIVDGSIAIIDELDEGIHEILERDLLMSLLRDMDGQLVMTTHNTLLMEKRELQEIQELQDNCAIGIPKESFYIMSELDGGNKSIECVLKYNNKIHINTNIRNQYLKGNFTGLPRFIDVDFKELNNILN